MSASLADLLLIGVTLIWGATFVLVKDAVGLMPPFAFLTYRFTLAGLAFLCVGFPRLRRGAGRTWAVGCGLGVTLFLGYALQTVGLVHATASKAAFITGLCVVMVPLLSAVWLKLRVPVQALLGAACATAGLAVLSLTDGLVPAYGDILVFGCAVAFAVQITAVARYCAQHDPLVLAAAMVISTVPLHALSAVVFEGLPAWPPAGVWPALVITGLFATTLAFFLQVHLQRFTSPAHAALIFTAEPVFAALFAWAFAGEVMGARELLGGGLVVAGMLLAEMRRAAAPGRMLASAQPPSAPAGQ